MNIEVLISKLIEYYNIKTITELAQKLNTTQSTVSGWRSRNAIGALADRVASVDPQALSSIFSSNTTTINQRDNGRAAARDYQDGVNKDKYQLFKLEDTTISLIKDLITKIGEEELQFKLMELKRNVK